eukprot:GHUV01002048.1.p1 GENE.GHUV01002048.1~~GHUV01002048.1.p1  ORF type:complete len:362 (+),score=135.85 GHUV01002048.1:212-1297(+)
MQSTLQLRRINAAGCSRGRQHAQRAGVSSICSRSRQPLLISSKFSNPFDGMFGGGNKSDPDAARRAIERSFGGQGKGRQQPGKSQPGKAPGPAGRTPPGSKPQPSPQTGGTKPSGLGGLQDLFKGGGLKDAAAAGGGGGFGGLGAGGGGGGGGWNWGGGAADEGAGGGEKPIKQELQELFSGMWVLLWNAALFLAVADVLHRSLDWCCQVELLLLVGAPAQAFERVAGKFYSMIEWVEANCLGWKIPGDDDMMPVYKQIALYYPEEHAYTFDSYKYNLTLEEKQALKRYYALRWWERDGGFAGDVTPAEIQKIKDKYNPDDVDLRAFRAAKAAGRLDEYWAQNAEKLKMLTGDSAPPAVVA